MSKSGQSPRPPLGVITSFPSRQGSYDTLSLNSPSRDRRYDGEFVPRTGIHGDLSSSPSYSIQFDSSFRRGSERDDDGEDDEDQVGDHRPLLSNRMGIRDGSFSNGSSRRQLHQPDAIVQSPLSEDEEKSFLSKYNSYGSISDPPMSPPSSSHSSLERRSPQRMAFTPSYNSQLFHRLKYYGKLASHASLSMRIDGNELGSQSLPYANSSGWNPMALARPPNHVLPSYLFSFPLIASSPSGKNGSLATIFSIWNTMVGSTILTIPWAFEQSGLLMGLGIFFIIAGLGYYTCILVVKNAGGRTDFTDVCVDFIGEWTRPFTVFLSLFVLLGASIVYHVLMSQNLYSMVDGVRETAGSSGTSSYWSPAIAALVVLLILFPLLHIKNITPMVKLNSFGIFFVLFLVIFIAVESVLQLEKDWKADPLSPGDVSSRPGLTFFSGSWAKLTGVLSLSFFIHNGILPILSNQERPERKNQDTGIAFILAGLCYLIPGVFTQFGYRGIQLEQNFLQMFSDTNIFAFLARICVFFQLCTVYPLLVFIMRCQLFGYIFNDFWPSLFLVIVLNLSVTGATTSFAVFYPHVGTIVQFVGSFCGFFYMYLFPVWVHFVYERQQRSLSKFSLLGHATIIVLGLSFFVLQFFSS